MASISDRPTGSPRLNDGPALAIRADDIPVDLAALSHRSILTGRASIAKRE
jgi:hypothetical protein